MGGLSTGASARAKSRHAKRFTVPRSSRSALTSGCRSQATTLELGAERSKKGWGDRIAWKEERNKERANREAQKVERAAALTALMAGQSEKFSVVCDHPLGRT